MGIFSSKKTYKSFAVSQSMIDSKDFKYSYQYAITDSIFDKSLNLSDLIIGYQQNDLPNIMNKAYKRASNEDKYIFGLPKDSYVLDSNKTLEKEIYKRLDISESIYTQLDRIDLTHAVWDMLINQYGYDSNTNKLSEDRLLNYIELYYTDKNKEPSTDKFIKLIANTENTKAIIYYTNTNKTVESFDVDLSDYINDELYIQVLYETDKLHSYTYKTKEEDLNELDELVDTVKGKGEYYPRLYLKLGSDYLNNYPDETKQAHTKRMARLMNLDLENLTKELKKSIDDDESSVKTVYINMALAVNKNKSEQITAKYLYRYFRKIYNLAPNNDTDTKHDIIEIIKDNEFEHRIQINWIKREELEGVVTNKGEYLVEQSNTNHYVSYQFEDNKYIKFTINELTCFYEVKGKGDAKCKGDDENLTIPLDRAIVSDLKIKERELLFSRCLQMQMVILKTATVKWYQRAAFQNLTKIAGIAISVFAAPVGLGVMGALQSIGIGLATGYAVSYGLDLISQVAVKLGISSKAILAIALITGLALGTKGNFNIKDIKVKEVMRTMRKSFDFYDKTNQLKLKDIQKRYDKLQDENKQHQEQLLKTRELLNTGLLPPSIDLIVNSNISTIDLYETVDEFYMKAYMVDYSQLMIDTVLNYPQYALDLTKPIIIKKEYDDGLYITR
ncbi:hypothetical protein ACF3NV_07855 [Moraxella atlantae]|uniref:hypothetical protein n=1 Tax=Faucicola atlantae TaxID=34059 RepID=UPI0037537723